MVRGGCEGGSAPIGSVSMYQVMRKRVGDYETHYFVVDLSEGLPESGLSISKPQSNLLTSSAITPYLNNSV